MYGELPSTAQPAHSSFTEQISPSSAKHGDGLMLMLIDSS